MNDTDLEDLDTQPPPLNVKCTDTDCEKNLHCFLYFMTYTFADSISSEICTLGSLFNQKYDL